MSKKKKTPATPKKPQAATRFTVGAQVRVKPGTTDPDFSDIPLGGWAGTIREVDPRDPPTYLIEWNRHTLNQMHPVYRNRCDRDGLDWKSMWLGDEDLEPDTGEPAAIEQPTNIVTRPLNEQDEDDRVRMALGLTSDDPPPDVEEATLLAYHRYLTEHLTFPFEAAWEPESRPTKAVKIIALSDPDDEPGLDETYGLFCAAKSRGGLVEISLADCRGKKGTPNWQLLADYAYWFWNNR
jgi:hypothetical protein